MTRKAADKVTGNRSTGPTVELPQSLRKPEWFGYAVLPREQQDEVEHLILGWKRAEQTMLETVRKAQRTLYSVVRNAKWLDEVIAQWPPAEVFVDAWTPKGPTQEDLNALANTTLKEGNDG